MDQLVGATISGLATGGIYAIAASGLTLTYATTGIFNFAHGATGMGAAFLYWELRFNRSLPAPLAFALVVLVIAPLWGIGIERTIARRLQGASEATAAVATIALLVGVLSAVLTIWPADVLRPYHPLFRGRSLAVFGTRVSVNDLIVLGVAVGVAVALRWLMYRTRTGVSMRATVDDRELSVLYGTDPVRTSTVAWCTSSMLAALAGVLIASKTNLNATTLTLLIVNAYAAAIVGRLRSIPLTLLGALGLGLAVDYGATYLPRVSHGAEYLRPFVGAIPVAVLLVVLLVLPGDRLSAGRPAQARAAAPPPTWIGAATLAIAIVVGTAMVSLLLAPGDVYSSTRMWGLGLIALSFVPIGGYAGKLSLCQLSFGGIGALVVGHLSASSGAGALLAGAGAAAVVGALVALPTLRMTGIYVALSTAAIAVAVDRWVFALPELTVLPGRRLTLWGESGSLHALRPSVGPLDLTSDRAFLVFGSIVFVFCLLLVVAVRRSTAGRRLVAMSDSPAGCETTGMSVRTTTVWVFAGSAAMAGLGGGLYAMALGSVGATRFDLLTGLSLLLMVVVAGARSPGAALVAALLLGTPVLTTWADELVAGSVLEQLVPLFTAGAAIGLGDNPNGFLPAAKERLSYLRDRRGVGLAAAAGLLLVWCVRAVGGLDPLPAASENGWWILLTLGCLAGCSPWSRWGRQQRSGSELTAPLEDLGLDRVLADQDLALIDQRLGIRPWAST